MEYISKYFSQTVQRIAKTNLKPVNFIYLLISKKYVYKYVYKYF